MAGDKETSTITSQVVKKAPDEDLVLSEVTKPDKKAGLAKGFTLKIEDNKGNEMEVRLPEDKESLKEPFEFSIEEDRMINLKWSAKGNVKGFNILRGEKGKEFIKINILPIPFFASEGGDSGLIYSFKDAGVVKDKKDKLYVYKIETILPDGTHKESKPIEISVLPKKRLENIDKKSPVEGGKPFRR
jgi:hypothetical protein